MASFKLYMLLLGCKPPGRHTEQHDIFFAVGTELRDLVPEIHRFWPEPEKIHIDAWREVNQVEGFQIIIHSRANSEELNNQAPRLFFINLGGYQENKFEEQHYNLLTVKVNRSAAYKEAKETLFFQNNHFPGAESHIDDKYGIDVDDLYEIEEMLSKEQKEKYLIELLPAESVQEDIIHLGYFKLNSL
jgi:hypothetical protein